MSTGELDLGGLRKKVLEVVVPFLNEEENLPVLYQRLASAMAAARVDWRLLLVDDGSTDRSPAWAAAVARQDPRVRLLRLSRNFGHQVAITAGIDCSDADAIVIMDADLQDPPELIPVLVDRWLEGNEVVYAVRRSRAGEGLTKRVFAAAFYRIFRRLTSLDVPQDAGDFRLLDQHVAVALRDLREMHRYVRGLTSWVGFSQTSVYYDRAPRHAGTTKYPVLRSLRLALDAITSFSGAPLRWMMVFGLVVAVVGFLLSLRIVAAALLSPERLQPGWASITALLLLLSGTQILCTGLLGQYVARIFEESKRRPLYVVRELVESRAAGQSSRT